MDKCPCLDDYDNMIHEYDMTVDKYGNEEICFDCGEPFYVMEEAELDTIQKDYLNSEIFIQMKEMNS